jgi:hypothetical protein
LDLPAPSCPLDAIDRQEHPESSAAVSSRRHGSAGMDPLSRLYLYLPIPRRDVFGSWSKTCSVQRSIWDRRIRFAGEVVVCMLVISAAVVVVILPAGSVQLLLGGNKFRVWIRWPASVVSDGFCGSGFRVNETADLTYFIFTFIEIKCVLNCGNYLCDYGVQVSNTPHIAQYCYHSQKAICGDWWMPGESLCKLAQCRHCWQSHRPWC